MVISNLAELDVGRLNKADGEAVAGETAILTLYMNEPKEGSPSETGSAAAPAADGEEEVR